MDMYQKLKSITIFEQGNHNFIVTVNAVICDAPARQFPKFIRSSNSRYACESSAVETEYFEKVWRFYLQRLHYAVIIILTI